MTRRVELRTVARMSERLVLTRAAVRDLDRRAIEEYGIPSIVLMENAGRACVPEVLSLGASLDGGSDRPVVVLCGPGNNGGDGFVIARTLHNLGTSARVFFVGAPSKLEAGSADVLTNVRLWRGLGASVETVSSLDDVGGLGDAVERASVVVDALFGTGLDRALREPWAEVVRAANARGRPTLAVDVPSGLDADTGAVLGEAVRADVTVSFVARKAGFDLGAGPACCGRVVVAEIGIPRAYLDAAR